MAHGAFEWDERKGEANLRKHGVSFPEAAKVLADPMADRFHLDMPQHRGNEDRWATLASYPEDRRIVLYIVWTEREGGESTRIISARRATKQEHRRYARQTT